MEKNIFSMPNYTTEELIQYVYNETTPEKTEAIGRAIKSNWALQEKIEALESSMQQLDSILVSPRQQSVLAILNYAKTSSEVEQP